jgi:EF-P beta-lysylation protein EpmB
MAFSISDASTSTPSSCPEWQTILAQAIRSPAELCRRLRLDDALSAEAEEAACGFPLFVPQPYLDRIRPGDPDDPLLRQVLPRKLEGAASPGFDADPLGEFQAAGHSGFLRKYQGRILIVTTGACAVHCRFCFRRHFPYQSPLQPADSWKSAFQAISNDPSINEVILSGGDPLTLADSELAHLSERFSRIPHLRRVRIHTRLPIMIPQRVNHDLLTWLRGGRLSPIVVVHVNHPAEIDSQVGDALARLVDAGVPVLSQSVLLQGVNDQADVLVELYQRLANLRVIPYYLHQLDRVAGAAHFEVPVAKGLALIAELRARLPGYAVPRYVRETEGGTSKELLA